MPKSKEFIESSDEGSGTESSASTTKKPIAKSSNSNKDVSHK